VSGGKICSNLVSWSERIEEVEMTVKDEKRWEDDIHSLLGRMNGAELFW